MGHQLTLTCLSREVEGFIRLDECPGLVGFDHDFSHFFWVNCVSSYLHLKIQNLFSFH